MRSPVVSSLALLIFASAISAHWLDWVDGLPDCWQECLQNTDDGCDSGDCICDASQSNQYLPPAVSCAATTCESDDWAIDSLLLTPLQLGCGMVGNAVPDDIMSSASAAATATSEPEPLTTRRVEHSQRSESDESTSERGDDQLTECITSTMTKTTTDGDGNTLLLIVPVVMGPDTTSFGKAVTSTIQEGASTTAAATPSPTAEVSAPAPTQAEQPQAESSTTGAEPTQRTSNSNGSPFENMQAGAGRWRVSGVLVGMSTLAGLLMRM